MTDHLKGLLITFTGVLFILPDSLFVRLIGTDGVTVAFWKALLIGLVLGLGLLVTRGPGVYRATFAASPLVWVYAATSGASGALFVIAVAHTSIANVVFIVAAMPLASALFSRIALGEAISRRTALTMAVVPVAYIHHLNESALHVHRRLRHQRRGDHIRWDFGESGDLELVNLRRILGCRPVHGLGNFVHHHRYNELTGGFDVGQGILDFFAIFTYPSRRGKNYGGRVIGYGIEK